MIAQDTGRVGSRRLLAGPSNEPDARQEAREGHDASNNPQSGAALMKPADQEKLLTTTTKFE